MTRPIYLAGPISYGGSIGDAILARNLDAFHVGARALRGHGHDVISPAEFYQAAEKTWSDHLREGVTAVCAARMVAVLPGWECSKGALLETHVAHALGLPVVPLSLVASRTPGTDA